jgi:hypothetical protein
MGKVDEDVVGIIGCVVVLVVATLLLLVGW